ncbi:TPA: hypothetical protein ACYEQ8_005128, partial [Escherichia coli]
MAFRLFFTVSHCSAHNLSYVKYQLKDIDGQYAVNCILVQPRTAHAAYPTAASFFSEAVEL